MTSTCQAEKISVRYEKPSSKKHLALYRSLKSNHNRILGESARYLNNLYDFKRNISVVVTSCGFVNSRYQPPGEIVLCYESLYAKVGDYPKTSITQAQFDQRVFKNIMFTFWHEVGHAIMDQFEVVNPRDDSIKTIESLADEFAVLSMLWRADKKWKDVLMISALHFKNKSSAQPGRSYNCHPKDRKRYEKIIALLYGFAQKSYFRLSEDVSRIDWLEMSAREYYLDRSDYWEKLLRNHTRRNFFNN